MFNDRSLRGMSSFRHLACATLVAVVIAASPQIAQAATILVINNDGAGEGFNDPTPASPVGGNTGTTIGAQRLIAFQRAAEIWGARLSSSVTIRVRAQFDPQSCNASGAVLGAAGPLTAHRDFTGAPVSGTWYPAALANARAGSDLSANDDINATFNSTIGTTCAFPLGWYYGLDGNPGSNIDFLSVLLHELGHGLGFLTFVDLLTGAKFNGYNDIFMRYLEHHGASPPDYPSMTNAQRLTASTSTGNLHWTGANVRAASGILSAGRVGDHVRMYAPATPSEGSSVSHWDTALTPNQMMEPSYTQSILAPGLELPLFQDIGWTVVTPPEGAVVSQDFNGDTKSDVLWRNTSGYVAMWLLNGNVVTADVGVSGVDPSYQYMGTCDFNGDRKSDVLWRHTGGYVAMWLMNGNTIVSNVGVGSLDTAWQIIGTGDFDGDGKCDILWRHSGGYVAMWRMSSNSILAAPGVAGIGTDWTPLGTGDFDGDGKTDIAWRHTNGSVGFWLMNSNTVASSPPASVLSTSWQFGGIGDFNGDSKKDIVWRHTSGYVALWLMNGGTVGSAPGVAGATTDWQLAKVGDINGDGKPDLLWRHSGGYVAAWLMNNTTVQSSPGIAGPSTVWQMQTRNPN